MVFDLGVKGWKGTLALTGHLGVDIHCMNMGVVL
jgi:hypothetical protein